jgi:hypothetical protein
LGEFAVFGETGDTADAGLFGVTGLAWDGGVVGLVGVTVSPGVCGLAGVTVLVPSGAPVVVGSLGSAEGPVVAAATTTPDPGMG